MSQLRYSDRLRIDLLSDRSDRFSIYTRLPQQKKSLTVVDIGKLSLTLIKLKTDFNDVTAR